MMALWVAWGAAAAWADAQETTGEVEQAVADESTPTMVQAEVVGMADRLQHEFFLNAPLDAAGRLGLFTFGRFAIQQEGQASVFASTQAIVNLTPGVGVALGGQATEFGGGPSAALSLLWVDPSGRSYVNVFPTVLWDPAGAGADAWSLEWFVVAASTPRLSARLDGFVQVVAGVGTPLALDEHLYSYGQLRLGLSVRGWMGGLAVDGDAFGPLRDAATDLRPGLFFGVRTP